MRAVGLFLVIFGLISALIFGYKYITKNDIKITGKLIFAGIMSLILTTIIYLGEMG